MAQNTVRSERHCVLGVRNVDLDASNEAKSAVYRDRPETLNELKTAISVYIRNISQADIQNVFANKIKRVQTCMDACGHHFQHHL